MGVMAGAAAGGVTCESERDHDKLGGGGGGRAGRDQWRLVGLFLFYIINRCVRACVRVALALDLYPSDRALRVIRSQKKKSLWIFLSTVWVARA